MINIFVAVAEITASVVGVGAGVFGVVTYFKDRKRNTKKDTLDAYSTLQKETFNKINPWLPSEIKSVTEDATSESFKELSGYLADIERFCVGINEGIYDFDTFYLLAHGYFDSEKGLLKPRLIPIIEKKLEISDKNYFSNIHEVWRKMDERSLKR